MGIGSFIGGSIGWAAGGPIGALMGFALGSLIDGLNIESSDAQQPRSTYNRRERSNRRYTGQADFNISLLILSAAVMKADGKPMKSELDYVKRYLTNQFGPAQAGEYIRMLREILKKQYNLRSICMQIQVNMQHPLRLQLIHYLFGIAHANNHVHSREIDEIRRIAGYLRISTADLGSISSMFVKSKYSDYKILEVSNDVSDDGVKKAYRKMAKKYHPDKVIHLGEAHQKAANTKFQKIQEAYENIKKERGMP